MNCVFNESSASPKVPTIRKARQRMRLFIGVLKLAKKAECDRLRVRSDFRFTELAEDYSIQKWLYDKSVDVETKRLLASFTRWPYISSDELDLEDDFLQYSVFSGSSPAGEGLTVAAIAAISPNGPMLSIGFLSTESRDADRINLRCVKSHPPHEKQEFKICVPNANRQTHVRCHLPIISEARFKSLKWKPSHSVPLPKTSISSLLVLGNWSHFFETVRIRPYEKIPRIRKMAEAIARINGYEYNRALSSVNSRKSNSLRVIYSYRLLEHFMHLSVDFEKGVFEFYAHNGAHLGEVSFSGQIVSLADSSGAHDLYLS